MERSKRVQLAVKVKQLVRQELPALCTFAAMAGGAAVFVMIVGGAWNVGGVDWKWFVLVGPLFGLPKAFAKIKDSQEPYLVRFARAFREGFLSAFAMMPNLLVLYRALRRQRGIDRNINIIA